MAKHKKRGKERLKNRNVGVLAFPANETSYGPSPLEAYPEHAMYIAYIIAEWSQIEYKLAMWLALRLSTDKHIVLPMVYRLETSRARLDMMAAGLRELLPDHNEVSGKFEKLLGDASGALNLRNKYAHAHYGPDNDSGELAIAGMGKKKHVNVPLHELKSHFAQMQQTSHTLGLILAAELELPLLGPDKPETMPAHPLGKFAVRVRPAPLEQPQSSGGLPEVPPASSGPMGKQRIGRIAVPKKDA